MDCAVEGRDIGLQNYEIHHEIGRGCNSVVYLATCKRGRLRNRKVALKKVFMQADAHTDDIPQLASSAALHQSLFHPSIPSLLSTFSTHSARYHVMELCANGTLHGLLQSRHPPVLSEAELRGVLKSLVGALTYLRKRFIIHRDIKPSNVLLGEDCRVKLSDFGLALQVDSTTSTVNTFCGSPNYVSPEIVGHRPYSFATDLWSLGCLAVTCLSGKPAFEASETAQIFAKISRCQFDLPDTASYEARDLITSLLQIDSSHRIPLHRILSHPFFNPSLPVTNLVVTSGLAAASALPSSTSSFLSMALVRSSADKENQMPPLKPCNANSLLLGKRPIPSESAAKTGRRVFSDPTATSRFDYKPDDVRVRSVSSYTSLRLEDTQVNMNKTHSRPSAGRLGTHLVSATSGTATPALTADSALSNSASESSVLGDDLASELDYERPLKPKKYYGFARPATDGEPLTRYLADHPLLLPPKSKAKSAAPRHCDVESTSHSRHEDVQSLASQPIRLKRSTPTHAHPGSGHVEDIAEDTNSSVPGPTPLNTTYLVVKTHKLSNGNITILPSKSLLVDFREGERRKGRKGDQVFVVSPDGNMVKVYDAPHLSTPCCLAEATAEYLVRELPHALIRQYSEAAKVVDKLKQRIPKLILNEDDTQYTLMANEPLGDIEITLSGATSVSRNPPSAPFSDSHSLTVRIHLIRAHRTIQISRSPTGARSKGKATGEWTKRIIPTHGHGYQARVPKQEADLMDDIDREGLAKLYQFLKICEAVEKTANSESISSVEYLSDPRTQPGVEDHPDIEDIDSAGERTIHVENGDSCDTSRAWKSTLRPDMACGTASGSSHPLGSIRVVPRPPKLSNTSASSGSNVADIGDSRRIWPVNGSNSAWKIGH